MNTPPPDIIDQIAVQTYLIAAAFRRHGDALSRGLDQTQARWQILRIASGARRTVPQIARRLGVSRQNVQRIADLLVLERLAEFAENKDHKLSPHLVLTEKGQEVLDSLSAGAADYGAALVQRLSALDLPALLSDLKLLAAALSEMDTKVEPIDAPGALRAEGRTRAAGARRSGGGAGP